MLDRQKRLRPESIRYFTIRGGQGHRLESLSDGVFALAIAILLISSSVPKNFNDLLQFVYDALPLFICMIFIYSIWHQQTVFFLRYGLYDKRTIQLNLILLFLTLFYAYPLKFLMTWLLQFMYFFGGWLLGFKGFGQKIGEMSQMIKFNDMPLLMIIYGLGFLGIFFIFYLLYSHAFKQKEALELNEVEKTLTRFSIIQVKVVMLVATVSVVIAFIGFLMGAPFSGFFAGLAYNLLWIISIPLSKKHEKQLQTLLTREM
ncbi:MAG: TMEM175 family protein [Saprospiraceae bacterium]|nr:TMEM175 family protein [Saprospiraceae bacterium]